MDTLIEELIAEIKKDTRYLSFLMQEERMQDKKMQELLKEYQDAVRNYQEVKEYENHIDITESLERMREMKNKVAMHPVIKEYYQTYHQINLLLEEVTEIIYKDISEDLVTSRYTL